MAGIVVARTSYVRLAIASAVFLMIGAAEVPAGGVKLKLKTNAANLYAPARVTVTAELTGGSDSDPALHCLREEWSYVQVFETVTNYEVNKSVRESRCDSESQTQPSTIVRDFKNDFSFYKVGRYSVRLQLRNREGKVVASSAISVRILQPSNPYYQD